MVVGDCMEVFLGIERAAQEECKATVCRLDDISNLVDRLTPIESVHICEPVLEDVGEHDAGTECLGHTRKKSGIHDGRTTRIRGGGRDLPISLGVRGSGTKTGGRGRGWNGLISERRTHVCRRGGGQGPRAVLQRAIATEGRHRASGV